MTGFLLEFCLLELVLSIPFWFVQILAHAGMIPERQWVMLWPFIIFV